MKKLLAHILCSAFIITIPTSAHAIEDSIRYGSGYNVSTLSITKPLDTELTCGSLSEEAEMMRKLIFATQDIKERSTLQKHGITAAGAVGSFLIGSVTGGIGLAVGGFLLEHNNDEREEKADIIQDIAAQRRMLMKGIFYAKGCQGPIEHAMLNPQTLDTATTLAKHTEYVPQTNLRRRYND